MKSPKNFLKVSKNTKLWTKESQISNSKCRCTNQCSVKAWITEVAQCTESSRQGIFGKIAKFEFFGPKVDF